MMMKQQRSLISNCQLYIHAKLLPQTEQKIVADMLVRGDLAQLVFRRPMSI
jgi:hypothetical protein